MISTIVTNEIAANSEFKLWKRMGCRDIKFDPLYTCVVASEEKFLFSHAIAKFQNLVRFEE